MNYGTYPNRELWSERHVSEVSLIAVRSDPLNLQTILYSLFHCFLPLRSFAAENNYIHLRSFDLKHFNILAMKTTSCTVRFKEILLPFKIIMWRSSLIISPKKQKIISNYFNSGDMITCISSNPFTLNSMWFNNDKKLNVPKNKC